MRTDYFESALVRSDSLYGADLVKAEGALCPDGKRRNAFPSGNGNADTFSSIPAFVYVGRKRVYGFVTLGAAERGEETVKFVPHADRKNAALIGGTVEEPEPATV